MRFITLCSLFAARLFAADQSLFDYDRDLPLDVKERQVAIRNNIRVALLNFAVTPKVRADCMLVTPARGVARTAAIIWMHSSGAFSQLSDAMLLAQTGAVSLLINPIFPDWGASPEAWREPMIQAVISIRRGTDLLLQRSDVDPRRLGFVGHSYGAMIGVDAAAGKRFRAAVFEVGLPGMSVHIRTAPIQFAAQIRSRLGTELDAALSRIEPLDAIHYVGGLAPTALLFQSAHLDPGVPDDQAKAFFEAASEPKALKWYDTGHEVLDIAAISDRARFLVLHLKLKPIESILRAKTGAR